MYISNVYAHKIVRNRIYKTEVNINYDHEVLSCAVTHFIVCFKNSVRGGRYGLAGSVVLGGPNG